MPAVLLLCLLGLAAHAQEASGDKPAQGNPAAADGGDEQKDCVRDVGKSGEGVLCVETRRLLVPTLR